MLDSFGQMGAEMYPRTNEFHMKLVKTSYCEANWSRVFSFFISVRPGPNHFGQLPCGLQNLAGVDWDIRCYVRLGRKPWDGHLLFPTNVTVPVGQTCQRIHFLHASDEGTELWDEVGRYVVHFADGTQAEIPICSRCDLFSHVMSSTHPLSLYKSMDLRARNAVSAWAGKNPALQSEGRVLRLFKFTWENPNGPKEVASIELTSGQSPAAAPFVVAITVEYTKRSSCNNVSHDSTAAWIHAALPRLRRELQSSSAGSLPPRNHSLADGASSLVTMECDLAGTIRSQRFRYAGQPVIAT